MTSNAGRTTNIVAVRSLLLFIVSPIQVLVLPTESSNLKSKRVSSSSKRCPLFFGFSKLWRRRCRNLSVDFLSEVPRLRYPPFNRYRLFVDTRRTITYRRGAVDTIYWDPPCQTEILRTTCFHESKDALSVSRLAAYCCVELPDSRSGFTVVLAGEPGYQPWVCWGCSLLEY